MMDPKGVRTVDDYIAQFPPERQKYLIEFRRIIRENAPDAVEKISWGMPTYHQRENLIHFASGKNHSGLYPGAEAMVHFAGRLAGYKTGKGSIQFPVAESIPYDLIAEITRWRVQKVLES